MSWETRNGGRYYYRKKRVHGRVVSEYGGGGLWGAIIAADDAAVRREQEQHREAEKRIRRNEQAIDQQIAGVATTIEMATEAFLIAAGFHKHRGQWRKKRYANQ